MQFLNRTSLQLVSASAVGLGLALLISMSGGAATALPPPSALQFDVAEDASRFVFDETPLHGDGLPAYGNEFVTQGYLYPPGTLTCVDNGCDGVNPDGSPEFPDLVIGTWTLLRLFHRRRRPHADRPVGRDDPGVRLRRRSRGGQPHDPRL